MRKSKLSIVPRKDKPLDLGGDIYAEGRDKREDKERWARVHIDADRRNLPRRWWQR
jgi:hypothetical protein